MTLPMPPKPGRITSLSPSIYEAARLCKARAAWIAFGDRGALPGNSSAILGLCFHEVVAAAQSGRLRTAGGDLETAARRMFDDEAEKRFAHAHEVFKAKFGSKERLPYYYMQREAAAALVRTMSEESRNVSLWQPGTATKTSNSVERTLKSKDGLLSGRPDLIAASIGEVVDFKARRESVENPDEITERETRQLRLYAHLAKENEIKIQRGVIVLASGRRLTIDLISAEVQAEVRAAIGTLQSYNAAVGDETTFEAIAEPSPENCRHCPCMVICEPFWKQADAFWQETIGIQVQGRLISTSKANLQSVDFVTLHLEDIKGTTIDSMKVVLEQIPEEWLLGGLGSSLVPGTLVRIMNAHIAASTPEQIILRADRAATEVWIADR
jgi:hypothetical protein